MTRQRHILWLLTLLMGGCTLLPDSPTLPTPVRPPELYSTADALRAALEGDYPLDALTIHYSIGNEAWGGHTALLADGTGTLQVSFDLAGKHDAWSSTLTEDEFLALVRLLVDRKVWAVEGRRQAGVPDEAYPTITIEAEGFEPLVVGMWQGEARDHADFAAILDVLAGLAREVSGGVAQ